MINIEKLEDFVSKVARVLGMGLMLLLVLVIVWNVFAYSYSIIRPIFNQKYPKIEFNPQEFKKSSAGLGEQNNSLTKQEAPLTEKLATKLLLSIKKDYEATLSNLVRTKGIGIVRGQLSDELRKLSAAELNESLDAVINDTTPKYWEIFFEKSKERISSDLSYQFVDESFQEDAADKLEEYLKESMKAGVSPYAVMNYQGEEIDFITDIRQSKVYKRYFDLYANGLSDLNSKNAQEEFFTNTRLIVLGSILLLLPFLGVLFSIMRIEKHLAKK